MGTEESTTLMKPASKLDQLRALREARYKKPRKKFAITESVTFAPVTVGVTLPEPARDRSHKIATGHAPRRDTSHPDIQTLHAMAGELCPLCGQRIPTKRQSAAAERQRLSRARRKGNG